MPDDEQFVPDFQPDSCEYLRFNIYTQLPCTLDEIQRRQPPLRELFIIHVLFQVLDKFLRGQSAYSMKKIVSRTKTILLIWLVREFSLESLIIEIAGQVHRHTLILVPNLNHLNTDSPPGPSEKWFLFINLIIAWDKLIKCFHVLSLAGNGLNSRRWRCLYSMVSCFLILNTQSCWIWVKLSLPAPFQTPFQL